MLDRARDRKRKPQTAGREIEPAPSRAFPLVYSTLVQLGLINSVFKFVCVTLETKEREAFVVVSSSKRLSDESVSRKDDDDL